MPVFTAETLSGSTNGQDIAVIATTSPGTTIHTLPTATGIHLDVWLTAKSQATTDRILTLENVGTATTFRSEYVIPAQQSVQILHGQRYHGGAALVMRAFATATGGLLLGGAVNRATP